MYNYTFMARIISELRILRLVCNLIIAAGTVLVIPTLVVYYSTFCIRILLSSLTNRLNSF